MARGSNFYYQGQPEALGAALGQTLGRALFGDPEAAREQQESLSQMALREAQSKQAEAHARLFGTQADGQGIQNSALGSLPQLFASLVQQPAPAAPVEMPSDPLAPLPEAALAPQGFDEATFKAGLPAVIAALAQSRGENVDLGETIGALGAMLGNDEFARRGLIAQGHTPGEDFALTPERADAISARDAGEDFSKDTSVARINHESDIPVANIQAGARIKDAEIGAGADRDVADIKQSGTIDLAAASTIGNQFGRVTSTSRTPQHNKDVGGVPNSYHTRNRAIDIARGPGVSHKQIEQAYRNAGYTLIESLDEGDHSHFAFASGPGGKKGKAAGPAVKAVDPAKRKMLTGMVDERLKNFDGKGDKGRFKAALLRVAVQEYQRTGNPDDAVAKAWSASGLGKPKGAPQGGGPVRIAGEEDFAKLASGTQFIGPDGKLRVKP